MPWLLPNVHKNPALFLSLFLETPFSQAGLTMCDVHSVPFSVALALCFFNRISFDGGHDLHIGHRWCWRGLPVHERRGTCCWDESNAVDEGLSSRSPLHRNHLEVVWIDTSIISVRVEWWLMPQGEQVEWFPPPTPSDSPASNLN